MNTSISIPAGRHAPDTSITVALTGDDQRGWCAHVAIEEKKDGGGDAARVSVYGDPRDLEELFGSVRAQLEDAVRSIIQGSALPSNAAMTRHGVVSS